MNIREIMEGKRAWQAHQKRVKTLPKDYQIVYGEMQKYLFKVGPVDQKEGTDLLAGIVNLFEEGAADGKSVQEVIGNDAAAFCDELLADTKTYADLYQETVESSVKQALKEDTQPRVDSPRVRLVLIRMIRGIPHVEMPLE